MKKQWYKSCIGLMVVFNLITIGSYGQNPNLLPAGKYLLKMKATRVHLLAVDDQPEHSLIVSVARNGNDVAISTGLSKTNLAGQFHNLSDGSGHMVFAFSVKGTDNWFTLKGSVLGSPNQIDGSFVLVPSPGGAPPAGAAENQRDGTVGSFTLVPYTEKLQVVSDPGKTKEIYNSTEEWWAAFRKWMNGESF